MISTSIPNRIAKSDAGFTLVEVMIAIVLLTMISISIYQATTQTFKYRSKIINEGDFYGGIRLAMGLLDRDIGALFSPVNMNPKNFVDAASTTPGAGGDPNQPDDGFTPRRRGGRGTTPGGSGADPAKEAANAQQLEELQKSELGQTSDYWLGATDLTAIRASRFIGTENRLQFVTAAHMRVYKNYPESEFAKIVYELRDEKNSDLGDNIKVLVKIEDPNVFDDVEKKLKMAKLYPLLVGVTKLGFRYYRKDKKSWERSWDSSKDDMKGLYPDIIEVSLEVIGPSKLNYKGTYMFKPETPFYGMDPTL